MKRKELSNRDEVIVSTYAKVGNMSEVARMFNLTRERVRQILSKNGVGGPRGGGVKLSTGNK